MAWTLRKPLLWIVCAAAAGCAPWGNKPAPEYVTIQDDPRHDTKTAEKEYQLARRQMDKHLAGKRSDLDKAEEHLKLALAADVRFGPAHHALGMLYSWQKKLYLAAWEFEYAARVMPDRFEPLNNLGLVYDAAGKHEQAATYYRLARELAPNHPEVISNLARASLRSGKTVDEIRPILEDVVATDARPEWNRWAAEQLGMNPISPESPTLPTVTREQSSFPIPDADETSADEELPLIAPPSPDSHVPPSQSFLEAPLSGPPLDVHWGLEPSARTAL